MNLPKIPKIPIKFVILAGFIGAVVGLGAFAWLIKFTHSGTRFGKAYCMTCHTYQGRSEFWRDSVLHPASVTCAACHAPAGEFIPKEFCASQDLMNENCIRCHEDMLYNNDWEALKTNVQKIKIQHGIHIEKAQTRCTDCHNNVSHDSSPTPTNRPHMTKCFDCHDLAQTTCDTCHTEGVYPEPQVAEVSVSACNSCHIDFVQKSVQPKYPHFQHQKHLMMLMDCKECHSATEPHPKTVVAKAECLSCHHKEMDTKGCKECHERQFKLYYGEKFDSIKGHQDPMAKIGMSCELGCHKDIQTGQHSVDSVRQWCVGCHGADYGQMLDEWRATLGNYTNEIHALLSVAEHKACAVSVGDEACTKAKGQIDSAKFALDLVERGKGVHNFDYSQKILEDTRKKLQDTIQDLAKHEGELAPDM